MSNKTDINSFIKSVVYKVTLPIYLWSIGFETLDDYLDEVESRVTGNEEISYNTHKKLLDLSQTKGGKE